MIQKLIFTSFTVFVKDVRGSCQGLTTWVYILYRKPFFEPLDQILKKWSNFTIFQKNLAKNGQCQGLRPDGELIGDWPETITGRWTGGGGEEAAIGLRKVITQPMLKYWATEQIVTTAHHKQTTATIWLEISSNQKIEIENRKIEINASGKLLIGPTFSLFQSMF